jgi:hypothetical protein
MLFGTCHSVGEDDVVDGNENKFHSVSDESHYDKAHEACVHDLHVLSSVGLLASLEEVSGVSVELLGFVKHVRFFLFLSGFALSRLFPHL